MKLIYIAGPYRAATPWGVEQNIRAAEDVAVLVHKAGLFAVCPHANSRHMEGIADDAHFLAGTLEMMRRCDAVSLVQGWDRSEGSCAEVAEAVKLGLPVMYGGDLLGWFSGKPRGYRIPMEEQAPAVRSCYAAHAEKT